MKYGREPFILGGIELGCEEMMFYQYLPIKMPYTNFRLPENLSFLRPLLRKMLSQDICDEQNYIYATVKKMFVSEDNPANRPGWHCDGFGTNDINYIWYDSVPTEFCIQDFELSDDHAISMRQMEEQAYPENIITYPVNSFLRLDQYVVHRVAACKEPGYRTFVKISVSKEKYNLKGNAHNYLFNYKWDMVDMMVERNHPIG